MSDDEAPPEPPVELSPPVRLRFLIGFVVTEDIELENALWQLFMLLVLPSLAIHLAPRGFRGLYEDCRSLVSKIEADDVPRDDMLAALEAARVAHGKRNRVVHDHWMLPYVGSPVSGITVTRRDGGLKVTQTASDFEFLEDCVHELQIARIRIGSFMRFIGPGGGPPAFPMTSEDQRLDALMTLRGDFELMPGGGWRTERPET